MPSLSDPLLSSEPFMAHLGARWIPIHPSEHHVSIPYHPHLNQDHAIVHNGVLMTLLDVAMGRACRLADPEKRSNVTMEMKTSFMKVASGALHAQGVCLSAAGDIAFAEAAVYDQDHQLIAKASGIFKYQNK